MKSFEEKLRSVLRYPEMIEAIADVLDYGVQKGYPDENWLQPEGKTMSKKANFDSMNHHGALHFAGILIDESGLYHLAHKMTRAGMELTRIKRGIIHIDDMEKEYNAQNKVHKYPESYACTNEVCYGCIKKDGESK